MPIHTITTTTGQTWEVQKFRTEASFYLPIYHWRDGTGGWVPIHGADTLAQARAGLETEHAAGFAPAEVREQDARNYPHDEPCPRCGRRQWTSEAEQETCQACGWEPYARLLPPAGLIWPVTVTRADGEQCASCDVTVGRGHTAYVDAADNLQCEQCAG